MRGTVNGSTADPLLTARCAGSTAVRCKVCPRAVERHCELWAFLLADWVVCLCVCLFGHTQWLAHLGDVQDIARLELSCQEWNVRIPAMPCRTVAKGPQVGSIASRMPRRSIQCNPVLRIGSKEAVTSATECCNVLYRVARCTAAIIVIYLGHVSKSTCSVLTGESPYLPQSTDCNPHSAEYSRVRCRAKPRHSASQKCSAAHLTLVQCGRSAPLQQRSAGQSFHATQSNSSTVLCSALFRQVSGVLRSVGHSECAAIHFTAAGGLKPVEQYTHLLW